MKTETRVCASCAFFCRDPIADLYEQVCGNLVRVTVHVGTPLEFVRDPVATDTDCDQHQTAEESAMEDDLVMDAVAVGGLQVAEMALDATAAARAAIRAARLGA